MEITLNRMDKDREARKRSSLGAHRRQLIGEWHEKRLMRMRGTRTWVRGGVYNIIMI